MRAPLRLGFVLWLGILTSCGGGRSGLVSLDGNASASGSGSTAGGVRLDLDVRPVDGFLNSIGVCTHLRGRSTRELLLMRDAGIRHLRDEIGWAWVERVPGRLQIPADREEWVEEATLDGIDVLMILDYGNPVYEDQGMGSSKNPDPSFHLFERYVDLLVGHFKDRVHEWEIWNEPNGFGLNRLYGGDWRGGGWVDAYARLADVTLEHIRAIDPGAVVYTAGMEAPIAQLVVPHLQGDYDAVAVHPYCAPLLPEYAYSGMNDLRRTIERSGRHTPLVVTEQGYPTVGGMSKFMWKHSATITLDEQARYLLRVYCGNYEQGIQRTYWYDFVCDGTDPNNQEDNFGIVNAGGDSTRPAYDALKTLTTVLRGKSEAGGGPTGSSASTSDPSRASVEYAGASDPAPSGMETSPAGRTRPAPSVVPGAAGKESGATASASGAAAKAADSTATDRLWAESVLDRRAAIRVEPAPSAPLRALLLSRDSSHFFLILWKESRSRDPLVINGPNGEARAFHDDGAPETVRLHIPAFAAGRLTPTYVDPMLGLGSAKPLTVSSDGLDNIVEIDVKESPVVVELTFE